MGLSVTSTRPSYRSTWAKFLFVVMCSVHPSLAIAQEVLTDQVSIVVRQGKIFGVTSGEGIARQFLRSGEEILTIEAKGQTGFVRTNRRLLGFSGQLRRWVDLALSSAEQIEQWTVTSRMIIVRGSDRLYGFQNARARWKDQSLGAGETILAYHVKNRVAVIISNRRALGFSAFTGGFFNQDISSSESIPDVQINDNIAVLSLADRTLIFRSGLAIWAELP